MQKTKKPVLEESVFFGYDALKPSFRRGETVKVDEIAIILEDIRGKFDLVLEGHEALKSYMDRPYEALDRKIDKNTFLIGALNDKIDNVRTELCGEIQEVRSELGGKIDGVAADLAAHRKDTEAHRAAYRVREDTPGEDGGA